MFNAPFRWLRGETPTDIAIVTRDIGSLLIIQTALVGLSMGVSALFGEWYVATAFAIAALATGFAGFGARRTFSEAPAPMMNTG